MTRMKKAPVMEHDSGDEVEDTDGPEHCLSSWLHRAIRGFCLYCYNISATSLVTLLCQLIQIETATLATISISNHCKRCAHILLINIVIVKLLILLFYRCMRLISKTGSCFKMMSMHFTWIPGLMKGEMIRRWFTWLMLMHADGLFAK